MTLRKLFSRSGPTAAPESTDEAAAYPFPEEFVERLRLELGGARLEEGAAAGVQVGFQSTRLSSFLLSRHVPVFAVENDSARREAGERLTSSWPSFHLFAGAPDATGLDDQSVDFIVSDRALYWPDQAGVRREFARILRPGGVVALVTDNRIYSGGEQVQAFEAVLRACCPNFREKRETLDIGKAVAALFRGGSVFEDAFTGEQQLSLGAFQTQTEAMPVCPPKGDPGRAKLDQELRHFFTQWSKKGRLTIPTVCRVAFGHMDR